MVITPGDLRAKGGPIYVVGPLHVVGLDTQVELVADVRTGGAAVRGRPVPGSGVRIGGVTLTTIGTDAENLRSTPCSLRAFGNAVHELRLRRLAVEVHGDRLAVKGTPGLDVGAIDGHRSADQVFARNRRSSQLVGAEKVIRPSGEGRCISRPVFSPRRTTVAHLVRPRVGWCIYAATRSPLIAKIELTHSIASIHSSCSQGRMRFSAPTGFPASIRSSRSRARMTFWARTASG